MVGFIQDLTKKYATKIDEAPGLLVRQILLSICLFDRCFYPCGDDDRCLHVALPVTAYFICLLPTKPVTCWCHMFKIIRWCWLTVGSWIIFVVFLYKTFHLFKYVCNKTLTCKISTRLHCLTYMPWDRKGPWPKRSDRKVLFWDEGATVEATESNVFRAISCPLHYLDSSFKKHLIGF